MGLIRRLRLRLRQRRQQVGKAPFLELPTEIQLEILRHCDTAELFTCVRLVSIRLCRLAEDIICHDLARNTSAKVVLKAADLVVDKPPIQTSKYAWRTGKVALHFRFSSIGVEERSRRWRKNATRDVLTLRLDTTEPEDLRDQIIHAYHAVLAISYFPTADYMSLWYNDRLRLDATLWSLRASGVRASPLTSNSNDGEITFKLHWKRLIMSFIGFHKPDKHGSYKGIDSCTYVWT